jgi:hypothetical protein
MVVTSLDKICRNMLLKHRYPLHFYLDFLLYSAECLKELTLDDLKVINTRILTINEQDATIPLPSDYVDKIGVFVELGQRLHPLVEDSSLNPIPNYSSNFQTIQPYLNYTQANGGFFQSVLYPGIMGMTTMNFYGEPTGRFFGWAGGVGADTYKVIKERGIIQLNDYFIAQNMPQYAVLSYISSGQTADAATHIDIYADATIKAYINWQMAENSRTYSMGDKERLRQLYINERMILRARMSDLSITKLTRILQKNSIASPR